MKYLVGALDMGQLSGLVLVEADNTVEALKRADKPDEMGNVLSEFGELEILGTSNALVADDADDIHIYLREDISFKW